MTRDEVIERLCKLATEVATATTNNRCASDCFCHLAPPSKPEQYRFDEEVLIFIESAARAAVAEQKRKENQPPIGRIVNV